MKRGYAAGFLVGSLCVFLLCGCHCDEAPKKTEITESQTVMQGTLPIVTDKELVEEILCSKALYRWGYMSSTIPESGEGLVYLLKHCSPFRELVLERDTGLNSLKEYAPGLIAVYKENKTYRENALFMERLLLYMFGNEEMQIIELPK